MQHQWDGGEYSSGVGVRGEWILLNSDIILCKKLVCVRHGMCWRLYGSTGISVLLDLQMLAFKKAVVFGNTRVSFLLSIHTKISVKQ